VKLDCQCYLLAAGRGKRAGGPKAWRDCEGKPLLERQLEFLRSLMPWESVAVSIQADWLKRCQALAPAVKWVGVDPDAPALDSILALARVLPLDRWTFLYHVDMRVWERAVFEALAGEAGKASGCDALVPAQGGRRGHPVVLSPSLRTSFAGLDPAQDRLDLWLRSRRVAEVSVPFECVHDNWNV